MGRFYGAYGGGMCQLAGTTGGCAGGCRHDGLHDGAGGAGHGRWPHGAYGGGRRQLAGTTGGCTSCWSVVIFFLEQGKGPEGPRAAIPLNPPSYNQQMDP